MAEKIDLSTISVDWAKYIDKDFKRHRMFPFTAEKAVFGQNGKLLSNRLQDIENSISDAFSDIKDYVVGDYCIYLNELYRFTEAKPAGPWDGTKVVPVSISQVIKEINGRLSDLNANMGNYYALSGGTAILEDSDLNEFIIPGNYYCPSNSRAATLKNCPEGNAFIMKIELGTGENYPIQTIVYINTMRKYSRMYDPILKYWKDWVNYSLNSDIDNIAFIKRGIISNNTIKDEKFFKTLKPGMYQVSTNDETYLPSQWGTLMNFRGENNYGTMLMIDVEGIMYTRPYSLVNDSWYTNWKRYG